MCRNAIEELKMDLSDRQLEILKVVTQVSPKIILNKYREDCCIVTARIIIEVLKKLHFKDVKPFVVEANIFNETYVKKGRTPQSEEEAQTWLTEGAWQVVLGERTEKHEGKWAGHLAVLLNNRYMLDIAILQASRPHKQINLTPIFTTVPENFVRGEDKCGLMFNNCMVMYTSYPEDQSYQKAKDWWDVNRSKGVVSEVLSEAKSILAKK